MRIPRHAGATAADQEIEVRSVPRARPLLSHQHRLDRGVRPCTEWSQARLPVEPLGEVSPGVVVAAIVLAVAAWLAHGIAFGRAACALGADGRSALLMGLPVARTRIAVHAVSGFCASLGGVVFGICTQARGVPLSSQNVGARRVSHASLDRRS